MKLKDSVSLWNHQREEVDFIKAHNKTFLLGSCGVGKTLIVLAAITELGHKRSLILTVKPAMRSVWEEEIERFTDGGQDVLVLDKGTATEKDEAIRKFWNAHTTGIVVVNFETARKLSLSDYRFDFVVADESHRLKTPNSAQSIELTAQLRDVGHKVAMTGTAWDDRPTDVFSQERWLRPVKKGRVWASQTFGTWSAFFEQYAIYRTLDNIKIPTGYKNLDDLHAKLSDIFRYVDRDAVLSLPPVQHIDRRVTLAPAHMKAYRELKREMTLKMGLDEITVDNAMVLDLRLHQIAGGFYQADDRAEVVELPNGSAKLDELVGIAEEIGHEPFVIFTRFTEDVHRIQSALKTLGVVSKVLVGGRDEHRAWRAGEGQALIANIQAGSSGINLTRACYGILYSTGYSNTDYVQAQARIDRPGQTRPVTFFHIIARGTVDEKIRTTLATKDSTKHDLLGKFEEAS